MIIDFAALKKLWDEDSHMDRKALDLESLRIPRLHSKWYNILVDCKIEFKREEMQYAKEKIRAKSYYSGDYGPTDKRYKAYGAQPLKLKSNDLDDHCSADGDLQKIKLRMFIAEEKIEFILNVLNQINNRSFQISNAIKWSKFMNGDNT